MYLPKNRFKVKQVEPGQIIGDYRGPVIETSRGDLYKGGTLQQAQDILSLVQQEELQITRPFNEYPSPTEEDYNKGTFTRYFLYEVSSKRGYEVTERQFLEKRNNPGILSGTILWTIKRPIEDVVKVGGVLVKTKGARSLNQQAVDIIEKQFPGISNLFFNFIEFVK